MSKSPEALSAELPTPREGSAMADFVESVETGDPKLRVVAESAAKVEAVDRGVDTATFNPYSVIGELIASLPEGDREAAAEYITGTIVEPAGEVALAGAEVSVSGDDSLLNIPLRTGADLPPMPVVESKPKPADASRSVERHTTFVSEEDIEATNDAPIAPVIEIRPGASLEPPIRNKPTIDERVAVATRLKETAPGGKLSFSERRILNSTSRDARTVERRRLKSGDGNMKEVKALHDAQARHEKAVNDEGVARANRERHARRSEVARRLLAEEDRVKAALTIDGVLNDRAFRARMKTLKKQTKKSVNTESKTALDEAERKLKTAGKTMGAAEKNKDKAIKSRRWYRNTRMSKANRSAAGVTSYASRQTPIRSLGGRMESDEERRKRLEKERKAA